MYKTLLGAGALLLATATSASADWYGRGNGYGDYGGYGQRYYNSDYYGIVRENVRACREHERFHEALNAAHDQAHDNGFDDRDEHSDVHEALGEAHDEYHADHPGVQHCNYWYSQWYRLNHRYYRAYQWPYWSYGN